MRALAVVAILAACSPKHDLPDRTVADTAVAETEPPLTYPLGPYRGGTGDVIPDLTFEGYLAGSSIWQTIHLRDYWDPDGTRGIHALVIVSSVVWCPICRHAAEFLPKSYTELYERRGARFLHLLRESATPTEAATRFDVDKWRDYYKFPFDNGLDEKSQLVALWNSVEGPPLATPAYFIVDTHTMRITRRLLGEWGPSLLVPGLDALLNANGAPTQSDASTSSDAKSMDVE
jgi:hypothetical protein